MLQCVVDVAAAAAVVGIVAAAAAVVGIVAAVGVAIGVVQTSGGGRSAAATSYCPVRAHTGRQERIKNSCTRLG